VPRRLKALPRVCKRWARILGQPSAAWEDATIDLDLLHDLTGIREEFMDAQVVSAWCGR